MMSRRNAACAVGFVVWLASSVALAVPTTVHVSGHLTTSSGPVTGAAAIQCDLYNGLTGGTSLWTEAHSVTGDAAGLVYFELGSTTALTEVLFDGADKYLEVTINGTVLTPRMKLGSLPYATRAAVADTTGKLGTLLPTDIVTTPTASNGVVGQVTGNALTLGLATSGCTSGQLLGFDGANWGCADDVDTPSSYTASAPLSLSGSAISLSIGGCTNGQVLKYNGSAWACGTDTVSTLTGTAPIAATSSTLSLATGGCTAGQSLKYNGSSFACANDTDTTYTATAPMNVTGTTISLSTSGCTTGQSLKYNGSSFACANDTNTTYTATAPVNVTGSTISLSTSGCTTGQALKYNGAGFACAADADTMYTATAPLTVAGGMVGLSTAGCTSGQTLKWNGAAWACADDNATPPTGTAPIVVSGTTVALATTGCINGQVLKYNGVSWGCLNDADTILGLAGSGVASTAAHSDHNHTGTYLPVAGTASCTGSQKVTGINTSTGNPICAGDLNPAPIVYNIAIPNGGVAVTSTPTLVETIGTISKAAAGSKLTVITQGAIAFNPPPAASGGYCFVEIRVGGVDPGTWGLRYYGASTDSIVSPYQYIPTNFATVLTGVGSGTQSVELWAQCSASTTVLANPGGWSDHVVIVED